MALIENPVRMRCKIEISGLYSGNNHAARNFCLDKDNICEKSVTFAIKHRDTSNGRGKNALKEKNVPLISWAI